MRSILLAGVLLLSSMTSFAESSAVRGKFTPPDGKILLMVGQDRDAFNKYVASIGLVPAGFTVYTSVQNMDGLWDWADYGGGAQHAKALLDAYPGTIVHIGLWMVDRLAETAAGTYDENLDKMADWIKSVNRPVFLRIGYEFDFPPNGYTPEAYKKAFRHVVKRLRGRGADNVAFVWHSYAGQIVHSLDEWYPGDDFVDWFAISYFSQARSLLDVMPEMAARHEKPFMIAEATPFGIGTRQGERSWDTWFRHFFDFVHSKNTKAICYIDCDWETLPMFHGQGWGDARIEEDPEVMARWLAEIKKTIYIHSGPDLYRNIQYSMKMPQLPKGPVGRFFSYLAKVVLPPSMHGGRLPN
jgi:hypothetical protein